MEGHTKLRYLVLWPRHNYAIVNWMRPHEDIVVGEFTLWSLWVDAIEMMMMTFSTKGSGQRLGMLSVTLSNGIDSLATERKQSEYDNKRYSLAVCVTCIQVCGVHLFLTVIDRFRSLKGLRSSWWITTCLVVIARFYYVYKAFCFILTPKKDVDFIWSLLRKTYFISSVTKLTFSMLTSTLGYDLEYIDNSLLLI
jgi:hypothetical protein